MMNDIAMPVSDLTVVIAAGGESKRMGRPKDTIPFLGQPLICRSVYRLASLSDDMVITTNDPERLAFLHDDPALLHIRLVQDVLPERSSINGFLTALSSTDRTYVALVACDMVFASKPLFLHQYEIIRNGDYDAVVPVDNNGFEPFHGVYNRERMLEQVNRAIEEGNPRLFALLKKANVYQMSHAEALEADPRGGCFINLNTPEQLGELETRMSDEGMSTRGGFD